MFIKIKELLENPIFIKDYKIRKRRESRKKIRIPSYVGYLAVLTLPIIIIGMIFYLFKGGKNALWDENQWNQLSQSVITLTIFLQLFYFIFKSISNSFPLFSMEKELRTYNSLISSMLTSEDILKGKFLVAFYPLFLEITGLFPLFAILGLLFKLKISQIFAIYAMNVIFIIFFTLLGLYCSLTSNNSAKSHSRAAFIAGFLLVGTLLIDGIIFTMTHDFIPFSVFLNPGFAFASALYADKTSPTWFTLIGYICPILLFLASIELWKIMVFETSRLPEK